MQLQLVLEPFSLLYILLYSSMQMTCITSSTTKIITCSGGSRIIIRRDFLLPLNNFSLSSQCIHVKKLQRGFRRGSINPMAVGGVGASPDTRTITYTCISYLQRVDGPLSKSCLFLAWSVPSPNPPTHPPQTRDQSLYRPCLVGEKFSTVLVASNLQTYVWSIKCS